MPVGWLPELRGLAPRRRPPWRRRTGMVGALRLARDPARGRDRSRTGARPGRRCDRGGRTVTDRWSRPAGPTAPPPGRSRCSLRSAREFPPDRGLAVLCRVGVRTGRRWTRRALARAWTPSTRAAVRRYPAPGGGNYLMEGRLELWDRHRRRRAVSSRSWSTELVAGGALTDPWSSAIAHAWATTSPPAGPGRRVRELDGTVLASAPGSTRRQSCAWWR